MYNMSDDSGLLDFDPTNDRFSLPQDATSSSATTFGGALLSPAGITLGGVTTPGTSSGSEGHQSGAYTQLWRQYQQCERERVKLQQELEYIKYVLFSGTL